MTSYSETELQKALQTISSIITRCEKAKLKFQAGTSQHTLLKNRLNAMYISKSLLIQEDITQVYSGGDLKAALPPITSIIHKCQKAQSKYSPGTHQHSRYNSTIKTMQISYTLLTEVLNKKDLQKT